jgi:hypothetical protein
MESERPSWRLPPPPMSSVRKNGTMTIKSCGDCNHGLVVQLVVRGCSTTTER